eukprot:7341701-Prymnesium_polylepis.1
MPPRKRAPSVATTRSMSGCFAWMYFRKHSLYAERCAASAADPRASQRNRGASSTFHRSATTQGGSTGTPPAADLRWIGANRDSQTHSP